MTHGKPFSTDQVDFLKLFSGSYTNKKLTARFNARFNTQTSCESIRQACKRRGFKTFTSSNGQFRKGHKSWNKGMKGFVHSSQTKFKPGQLPKNTMQLGVVKVSGDGYLYKKVAETLKGGKAENWRLVHHLVWQDFHGEIPANHVIIFKDGNRQNCEIGNLACLSRQKFAIFNKFLSSISNEFFAEKLVMADLIMATKQAKLRLKQPLQTTEAL